MPDSTQSIIQKVKIQGNDISPQQIEIVLSGMRFPIREMETKKKEALLIQSLYYVGSAYCGVNWDNTSEVILASCAEEVSRNFGSLGIDEIREAFNLASLGRFDAEMTAWRGVFTISIVLSVLNGYKAYRNKIQKAILAELEKENELERIELDRKKNEEVQKEIVESFEAAQNSAIAGRPIFTSFRSVPHYWAKPLSELGHLPLDSERKKEIFHLAQTEAKKELIEISQSGNSEWKRGEAKAIIKALDNLKQTEMPSDFIFRANNNYCRLLVWEFINPDKVNPFVKKDESDDQPF